MKLKKQLTEELGIFCLSSIDNWIRKLALHLANHQVFIQTINSCKERSILILVLYLMSVEQGSLTETKKVGGNRLIELSSKTRTLSSQSLVAFPAPGKFVDAA